MNKWLKRALLALLVLGIAAGVARALMARKAKAVAAEQAAAALQVPSVFELSAKDVVVASKGTLLQTVSISGPLRALNMAAVKAKVAGELQDLTVREGDTVKAGQLLARIDTTEYKARVQQAEQQAQAAGAQVAIAKRQLDNNQALVNQGFISKTALDTSLSNLEAAQANHRAALAGLDVTRKALADTQLRSPINGQVATRLVQNGERVGVDARVLEVVDISALELEAAVAPADAAQMKVGQKATLNVEGFATPVAARVVRISPSAAATSRSVPVYFRVESSAGLRHGLFAQGQVVVAERSGVLVPQSALRNDRPQPYAQVVQAAAPTAGASAQPDATGSAASNLVIAHVPVKVLAQGLSAPTGDAPAPDTITDPFVLVDLIAENSILLSGTAGFMQEKTAVKLSKRP